jgi:hypothetical protein
MLPLLPINPGLPYEERVNAMQQAEAINESREKADGKSLRRRPRKNRSLWSGRLWPQLQRGCSKVIQGASQVRHGHKQAYGSLLGMQGLVGRQGRQHKVKPQGQKG